MQVKIHADISGNTQEIATRLSIAVQAAMVRATAETVQHYTEIVTHDGTMIGELEISLSS